MSIHCTISTGEDTSARSHWESLQNRSTWSTPFSDFQYVSGLAKAYDLNVAVHLVHVDAEICAGALLCWRKRGPFKEIVIPPFTPHSAFLVDPWPHEADLLTQQSALDHLIHSLADTYDIIRLHLPVGLVDTRVFQWKGFTVSPLYTYRATLPTDQALTTRWSRSTRNLYKKHQTALPISVDNASVTPLLTQVANSYERQKRPTPYDLSRLHIVLDALLAQHLLTIYVAGDPHDPQGALGVLHDARCGFHWLAGSVPGPAMTVLTGHALLDVQKKGIEIFDFVGANTPGIAEFKRKFDATLTPYFRCTLINNPLLNAYFKLKS